MKNIKKLTIIASILMLAIVSTFVITPSQFAFRAQAQSFDEVRVIEEDIGKEYTRVTTDSGILERDIKFNRT